MQRGGCTGKLLPARTIMTMVATTDKPNIAIPCVMPSCRVSIVARRPVILPAKYIAIIVSTIAQMLIPQLIPEDVTGREAFGLAAETKMAAPSMPKMDQIVMKLKTPAQMRPSRRAHGRESHFDGYRLL